MERLQQVESIAEKAEELEAACRLDDALKEFEKCLQILHSVYFCENDPRVKDMIRGPLETILQRVESLKKRVDDDGSDTELDDQADDLGASEEGNVGNPKDPSANAAQILVTLTGLGGGVLFGPERMPALSTVRELRDRLVYGEDVELLHDTESLPKTAHLAQFAEAGALSLTAIVREGPVICCNEPLLRFDDISGQDPVRDKLMEEMVMPVKSPELSAGRSNAGPTVVMLVGPPDCGQDRLAEACAGQMGAKLLSLQVDVVKNSAEPEKVVCMFFERLRSEALALGFVDRFEELFPACGGTDAMRRVKTEFLTQTFCDDRAEADRTYLLVSTTQPWDLNSSVRRRMGSSATSRGMRLVAPPDLDGRRRYLLAKIGSNTFSKESLDDLAQITAGYTHKDLEDVVCRASADLAQPPNFQAALAQVKPSAGPQVMQAYSEWFGKV